MYTRILLKINVLMFLTQVRLGEHDIESTEGYEQDINIAAVYKHALYGVAATHDRDIAVIKLASPAKFNSRVGPACLQSSNVDFLQVSGL